MTTPQPPEGDNPQRWAAPAGNPAGEPPTGNPASDAPQYGQQQPQDQPAPQYGQQAPPNGQPQWGQEQPQYGQQVPQYGQQTPQYGQQAPQYGQPQGNQWGSQPPQYGGPGYGQGPGGFNQHAKPGIVPLRPLSLGEIYDGAFTAIRRQPKIMLGLVALVVAALTLATGILGFFLAKFVVQIPAMQSLDQELNDVFGEFLLSMSASGAPISVSAGTIGALLMIGQLLATSLATGLIVVAISQSVLNRPITATEVFERGKKRLWGLLGISIVPSIIILLVSSVSFGGAILLFVWAEAGGGGFLILLGLLLMLAGAVFMVVISIRLLVAPAILMLEERKVFPSIKRSWQLTKGSFWRIFGIAVLTFIIAAFVAQAISTVLLLIANAIFPAGYDVSFGALLATLLVETIASTFTVAFTVAVTSLLYIDIRMRREALDVELLAAANFEN